jgi:hypothetical protein
MFKHFFLPDRRFFYRLLIEAIPPGSEYQSSLSASRHGITDSCLAPSHARGRMYQRALGLREAADSRRGGSLAGNIIGFNVSEKSGKSHGNPALFQVCCANLIG